MHALPPPLTRELVLVGGGHAHALVLRRWGMNPLPGARLTLVNPGPTAPYTGMLPGHVAGHYPRAALQIDLVRLARFAGARLILDRVTGLDTAARRLQLAEGPPLAYDIASLDIGITSDMPDLPGFAAHAVPAKPLDRFAEAWRAFRAAEGPARVTVIGGGVAGVELAMAMAHALAGRAASVAVIERGRVLADLAPAARRRVLARAEAAGIALHEGAAAVAVHAGGVELEGGRSVPSDFTVGAAGARPQGWLAGTGLALHEGFVRVGATLQSVTDPAIFAAGDCAHLAHAPRPKAGVFAVRAAPVLAANLRAALAGRGRLRRFPPQRAYLKLISLGAREAVAERNGLALEGAWVWRWKDRIDRRFMERLNDLPAMAPPPPPALAAAGAPAETVPLCGGCGSKLGPGALSAALSGLPPPARPEAARPPGEDAGLLRFGRLTQVLSTDHLRGFVLDPRLMARITVQHALGDVWAMGAEPQAALASVILPPLAEPMQAAWLAEIMAAAAGAFAEVGADILGGHSTQGAELTLGFTVTGVTRRAPITLAGARPGDRLVLTRPLGAGVLLAAEMRGLAGGEAVAALWRTLAESQARQARALAGRAHAMTDVTGFGLAGHALNMAMASGTGLRVDPAAVPLYEGAEALAAAGVRSTVWAANRAASGLETPDTPRAALLFDPQTAGGLLAALPPRAAESARAELAAAGLPLWDIGAVSDAPPGLTLG